MPTDNTPSPPGDSTDSGAVFGILERLLEVLGQLIWPPSRLHAHGVSAVAEHIRMQMALAIIRADTLAENLNADGMRQFASVRSAYEQFLTRHIGVPRAGAAAPQPVDVRISAVTAVVATENVARVCELVSSLPLPLRSGFESDVNRLAVAVVRWDKSSWRDCRWGWRAVDLRDRRSWSLRRRKARAQLRAALDRLQYDPGSSQAE